MTETLLRLLAINTCQLWRSSVCTTIPNLEKINTYMNNPRQGDWVLEISSLAFVLHPTAHTYDQHKDIMSYVGRLIIKDHEEFVEAEDNGYYDKFTYIENVNGKLFRWSNCRFIRILDATMGLDGFGDSDDPTEKQQWLAGAILSHRDDLKWITIQ